MKKIPAIAVILSLVLINYFIFAVPVQATDYKTCCICRTWDTSGMVADTYDLPSGGTPENPITDATVCNTHDAFSVDCEIIKHEECGAYPSAPALTKLEDDFKFSNVVLGITIPNLKFSAPPSQVDAEGKIYIPWMAEYIKAVYNFLVATISIVAVVMIIIAGAQIIASAGGPEKAAGYKRISQAVIGLFIAWGSYIILYTINPGMTTFKPIAVKFIEPEELMYDGGDDKDPAVGGVALPDSELALSKKSGPRMSKVSGLPLDGGRVGKCVTMDETRFQKFMLSEFDMNKFSDGSNGACLVALYNSAKTTKVSFLSKNPEIHPAMAAPLQAVSKAIEAISSPIVNYWKDPSRFKMAGCYVNYNPPTSYTDKCNDPTKITQDTIIVLDKKKNMNRLYTKIARVMDGMSTNINGDLHGFGLACDFYAQMNVDYRGKTPPKPLVTNVPKEVADAFMNNGFTWGGGHWGRDAMHFEYHHPSCYSSLAKPGVYPKGNGCCVVVDFTQYMGKGAKNLPDYNSCKNSLGGKDATYEVCMGPQGAPGSFWVQQNVQ